MKRQIIVAILVIFHSSVLAKILPSISIPPPPEYLNEDSICDLYKKLAYSDYEMGYFSWGSIGFGFGYLDIDNYDPVFNQFFENHLISKHNVRTLDYGCITSNHTLCYNHILDSLIILKLGNKFFN
jgi:hypothetical protein